MKPHVRWMIRRDRPAVEDIEARSFEFPWQPEDFTRALRQRTVAGLVAEHDDWIVGYMVYASHPRMFEVLNLCVAAEWRGRGVGRELLKRLTNSLSERRRNRVTVTVRERNLDAQMFLRACGFRAVNVIKDLYDDTDEDAYVMRYRIGVPVARLEPVE